MKENEDIVSHFFIDGHVRSYYGCCDRCLAVATLDVDEVYKWCSI